MTTSAPSAKTVLVADDTAFVRDRFKTALEGAGHSAVTVKSAAELLARVRADQAQLDLLVIDLRLPHAAGSVACPALYRPPSLSSCLATR